MTDRKQKHTLPPNNPALIQNSSYGHVHFDPAANDATEWPAWKADFALAEENIQWLPWVTTCLLYTSDAADDTQFV